jgi:hypothetical protein
MLYAQVAFKAHSDFLFNVFVCTHLTNSIVAILSRAFDLWSAYVFSTRALLLWYAAVYYVVSHF